MQPNPSPVLDRRLLRLSRALILVNPSVFLVDIRGNGSCVLVQSNEPSKNKYTTFKGPGEKIESTSKSTKRQSGYIVAVSYEQ